jgi:hypothetical protein
VRAIAAASSPPGSEGADEGVALLEPEEEGDLGDLDGLRAIGSPVGDS